MLKRCVYLLALPLAAVLSLPPAHAEITQNDLIMLGLMFRNRALPYGESTDAHPDFAAVAEKAEKLGRGIDKPEERYATLIHGLALMYMNDWNEGIELATVLDVRLPAKLYEPGDTVTASIKPVYDADLEITAYYAANLRMLNPEGKELRKGAQMYGPDVAIAGTAGLAPATMNLAIPKDASSGRYAIEYTLYSEDGEELIQGSRSFYVIENLRERLDDLEQDRVALEQKNVGERTERKGLAADTIDWHYAMYAKGLTEDIPGAYTDHPIFMTSLLSGAGMVIERMDFVNELTLAEQLARDLKFGRDALYDRTGDMRLAYESPVDGELVPFRIFVPDGYDPAQRYPLVVALHGAGGDENAFMDRYQGLYKNNAQRRGYIAVSVNGRGPFGGYRGESGQDAIDVLDLVESIYPIDRNRVYLTGHSMGGMGTVLLGFDNPDRFAALAPLAGFGAASQLEKAKDMPIFIGAGTLDALISIESARAFHQAANDLGMPHVKYVEKDYDHVAVVDYLIDDAFDWFDQHAKNAAGGD